MPGIDTSIYSNLGQGVTPLQNPMDAMSKAMAFSSLANKNQLEGIQAQQAQKQWNDDQSIKTAKSLATSVQPDGTYATDNSKVMDYLGKNNPDLVQGMQQQQAAQKAAVLKNTVEQHDMGLQMFNGVTDQDSYTKARNNYVNSGLPHAEQIPTAYDPGTYSTMMATGQSTKDYAQQQLALLGEQNKSKELGLALAKQYGTPMPANIDADTDPATLIKHAPQERQPEIIKEVGMAQSTANYLPKLLARMDAAHAKIQSGIYTPEAMNDDINAIKVLAAPLVKDVVGGNKQAAVDAFADNISPENKDKVTGGYGTKRQAAIDYAMGNMNAPASEGAGIHLNKFKSTSIDPSILKNPYDQPSTTEGSTYNHKGETYKVIGGNWVKQSSQAAK